ncbi:hypothetical protein QAD02_000217 [Eretmocerus hayati]|uniref:Uncharacterized protein n=1 Tax=Eretmocerus hayati TaxID=131215 RepID=A0ACC2NDV8_9HYME|nr:hypothetical protein QAD02_000217 [Eretmocerus hayati]
MVNDWLMEKTPWERRVMRKQAGRARIFVITSYMVTLANGANYVVAPYFGIPLHILNNITDPAMERGRILAAQEAFPFDVYNSPTFEVVYFVTSIGVIGDCMGTLFPVLLFATVVFHASGQYELLGAKMQHLFDDIEDYGAEDKSVFQVKLKLIVNEQTRLHR